MSSNNYRDINDNETLFIRHIVDELMIKSSPQSIRKINATVDLDKRLNAIEMLLTEYKLLPEDIIQTTTSVGKNNDESLNYREEGDKCFKNGDNEKAIEFYNKSIAFAKSNSEHLFIGYVRRLTVLFKIKQYEACLWDIDLALNVCPNDVKFEFDELRNVCRCNVKNSKLLRLKYKSDIDTLVKLTYPSNPRIPFIANCLELVETESHGRGIITNHDLQPGDVIVTEKPFGSYLYKSFQYRRCANCLKETWSLIPCKSCTSVMFCNQQCLNIAYTKFHKYECKIINYLYDVLPDQSLLEVRIPLQIILLFRKNIDRLIDLKITNRSDKNIFEIDHRTINYDVGYDDRHSGNDYIKNYYPLNALSINVTESVNKHPYMYVYNAVETFIIAKVFGEVLRHFIKTDKHKRFIRQLINRQLEVSKRYYKELYSSGVDVQSAPKAYGSAVYPVSALINHSCIPNIMRLYDGINVTIIVLRPIREDEELFDCYGGAYWAQTRIERQIYNKTKYDFLCKCVACEKNYPLLHDLQKKPLPSFIIDSNILFETLNLKKIIYATNECKDFLIAQDVAKCPSFAIVNVEIALKEYLSFLLQFL